MRLRQIIIGSLLISAVIIAFTTMLGSTATTYGAVQDNSSWDETFDVIQNITEIVTDQSQILEKTEPDTDEFNPDVKLQGIFKLVGKIPTLLVTMTNEFFQYMNLPGIYPAIIATIIVVIVLIAILTAIFKRELD